MFIERRILMGRINYKKNAPIEIRHAETIGARSRGISAQSAKTNLAAEEIAVEDSGGATSLVLVTVAAKLGVGEVVLNGACVVRVTLVRAVVVEELGALVDDALPPMPETGAVVSVTVTTLTDVESVPVPVTVETDIEVGSLVATVIVDVVPVSLELELLLSEGVLTALVLLEDEVDRGTDGVIEAEVTRHGRSDRNFQRITVKTYKLRIRLE